MNEPNPERLRRRRLAIALRSVSAAGVLALATTTACSSAHPVERDNPPPVVDVPSPASPCETQAPTCYPSPLPTETESPEPAESPLPSPTRTRPPLPRGFACRWADEDGKRQPLVSENPLRARIDGRCRKSNPLAPVNVYADPGLDGPVIDTVENGDKVHIVCAIKGEKLISDARNASRLILGIETHGTIGFIPEIRVGGGIDETQLGMRGSLEPCVP